MSGPLLKHIEMLLLAKRWCQLAIVDFIWVLCVSVYSTSRPIAASIGGYGCGTLYSLLMFLSIGGDGTLYSLLMFLSVGDGCGTLYSLLMFLSIGGDGCGTM